MFLWESDWYAGLEQSCWHVKVSENCPYPLFPVWLSPGQLSAQEEQNKVLSESLGYPASSLLETRGAVLVGHNGQCPGGESCLEGGRLDI